MKVIRNYLLHYIVCTLGFVLFFAQLAHAYDLKKDVVEYKLDNGMRWLLVRRHQAPVFSGVVMIRVGGADEKMGKTGLAHVFEHMAFKGSSRLGTSDFAKEKPILDEIEKVGDELTREQQVGNKQAVTTLKEKFKQLSQEAAKYQIKNEIWEVMVGNGASDLNAYTSKDVTAFHASMPINRLELWLDIFSQMVNDPAYREFYTERDVIMEERRTGVDNDPDGKMSEVLVDSSFQNGPYHWPLVGYAKDIAGLTIADARAFHDSFYVAQNMVGVLAGDLNINETKKLIAKYFGSVPSGSQANDSIYENKGGQTKKISLNAEPAAIISYHKPTLPNPDEFVFDVIDVLLCDGPTSRLEKRFIYDEKMASAISCSDSYPGSRLNNLMLIWAEPNRPYSAQKLASLIEEEINKLKDKPILPEELSRIRTKVAAAMIFSLEKNLGLALSLAEFETVFNDWQLIIKYPKLVDEVTTDDVMRVAEKYFTKQNMTEILRHK